MVARPSLREEGAERVIAGLLVGGHGAIGLDTVLQAVQLPAGVAHLDTGLPDMDGETFTLHTNQKYLVKDSNHYKSNKNIYIVGKCFNLLTKEKREDFY